jgi:hypothetical protein
MGIGILNQMAFGNMNDLTTPTAIRQYRLGQEIEVWNDLYNAKQLYKYVYASINLLQYQPCVISISSTVGQEIIATTPFTILNSGIVSGAPQVAIPSGYYGFIEIEGDGKSLMTAAPYAVGDMLKLINNATALKVDGTSGSTAFTPNTCAVCKESGNTAVARNVYFYGKISAIPAS